MRSILQRRPLRLVFTANLISMLGSGMNSAAVTWSILQATHSEMALGTLVVLQTIPAMLLLPFTGVIIDREDRRRLVMLLDAGRAVVVLAVALLAYYHRVHLWQLYAMAMLVAMGFWMFWPTITALIQELTPGEQYVQSNTFLLAGIQGGWLLERGGAVAEHFAARVDVAAPRGEGPARGLHRLVKLALAALGNFGEDLAGCGIDHADPVAAFHRLAIDCHRKFGHGNSPAFLM